MTDVLEAETTEELFRRRLYVLSWWGLWYKEDGEKHCGNIVDRIDRVLASRGVAVPQSVECRRCGGDMVAEPTVHCLRCSHATGRKDSDLDS